MLFGVIVKLRVLPVLRSFVVSSSNSMLTLSAMLTLLSGIYTVSKFKLISFGSAIAFAIACISLFSRVR